MHIAFSNKSNWYFASWKVIIGLIILKLLGNDNIFYSTLHPHFNATRELNRLHSHGNYQTAPTNFLKYMWTWMLHRKKLNSTLEKPYANYRISHLFRSKKSQVFTGHKLSFYTWNLQRKIGGFSYRLQKLLQTSRILLTFGHSEAKTFYCNLCQIIIKSNSLKRTSFP